MNKRIENIKVTVYDANKGMREEIPFTLGSPEQVADEFMRWLVTEGFYDDIQATKRFSVSTEVMNRLKGKS